MFQKTTTWPLRSINSELVGKNCAAFFVARSFASKSSCGKVSTHPACDPVPDSVAPSVSKMASISSGTKRLAAASSRLLSVASGASRVSLANYPAFAASSPASAGAPPSTGVLSPVPDWSPAARFRAHRLNNCVRSAKYRAGMENPSQNTKRKRIVFLGTGWSAMRFLPVVDTTKYEVVVVSPRNFFVFTPLLPSVCAGALSSRSCMEPIRRFTLRGGKKMIGFYEGRAEDVNFDKDEIKVSGKNGERFDMSYDYLVVGVGSEAATFGIPGVAENAFFLKESENADDIRRRVIQNFETANLPCTTDEEKRRLLHFVCVGGGPSGVETAAEIADLVKEEVGRYYPALTTKAKVSVIEMLPKVLPAFNDEVSDFTLKNFAKMKVDALLKTRVTKITSTSIHVVNAEGKNEELPCGFVLWASGIGQVPFSKSIMSKIPQQQNNRPAVMNVDEHLRVKGVPHKNVFAMGDCSFLSPTKLADNVDEIYAASVNCPTGAGTDFLKNSKALAYRFPQLAPSKNAVKVDRNNLSKLQLLELLKEIDAGYKPPVPTAQNAGQQGRWLACAVNDFDPSDSNMPAFVENFKGALAYVGDGESVALTPWFNILGGFHSTMFWKTIYWSMQMSIQNRVLLLSDWVRLRCVGRDLSCPRSRDFSGEMPPAAAKECSK